MAQRVLAIAVAALGALGCARSDGPAAPPAGTPTDPVAVCTRVADVCRMDASRLGVCTAADPAACDGTTPCLVCRSQH